MILNKLSDVLLTPLEYDGLEAATTPAEWNAAREAIEAARGGRVPRDYESRVLQSGLAATVLSRIYPTDPGEALTTSEIDSLNRTSEGGEVCRCMSEIRGKRGDKLPSDWPPEVAPGGPLIVKIRGWARPE